jgi:hypothetical protein
LLHGFGEGDNLGLVVVRAGALIASLRECAQRDHRKRFGAVDVDPLSGKALGDKSVVFGDPPAVPVSLQAAALDLRDQRTIGIVERMIETVGRGIPALGAW